MAILEARGLTKRFGQRTAVEDLAFEVSQGEVVGLLGPNGAGKTTTIRLLSGIIAPTAGYAVVAGLRADKEVERLHEVVGLLTETPGFYERLSAQRNLEFFAGFYQGLDVQEQVSRCLKLMGLWERRGDRVATFSKGMKQRLALARALLHQPKLLFLDEPTAGLDPQAAREVRELIGSLREKGHTVLLSTHNLAEAESLCDRIAIIKTRLLALDTPSNLHRTLFRRRVVVHLERLDGHLVEAVQGLGFVRGVEAQGNRLTVELSDPQRNVADLVQAVVAAGGRVTYVAEESHTLEEVYLALVREEERRDVASP